VFSLTHHRRCLSSSHTCGLSVAGCKYIGSLAFDKFCADDAIIRDRNVWIKKDGSVGRFLHCPPEYAAVVNVTLEVQEVDVAA